MDIKQIEIILSNMLESLEEFKSEDITYYEKQVSNIINHIKKLENQ